MKSQELLENMDPLLPADFFSCSFPIEKHKDQLGSFSKKAKSVPDMSLLLDEEKFATVTLAWSEEGIGGKVTVAKPFEESFFPDFRKGDSVEIFIDTRPDQKKGFATRFCHQFIFLAEEVNGIQAQEVTKFRLDDAHPLCSSEDLSISCHFEKKSYEIIFMIKENALHGYDPLQIPKIGFAYRINRVKGKPQHFPFSSNYFDMLQHPNLWASATLT